MLLRRSRRGTPKPQREHAPGIEKVIDVEVCGDNQTAVVRHYAAGWTQISRRKIWNIYASNNL
jgi:hypothetical protein